MRRSTRSGNAVKRIVVKLGTQVVSDAGALRIDVLASIIEDIQLLTSTGTQVVLVSSGAVACGRNLVDNAFPLNDGVTARQVYSALGQVELMRAWRELFDAADMRCAQVLATRSDFRDRDHYLNMQRCLDALLRCGVVPVVNENDVVSVTELMFTDNDEVAGLLAGMLDANQLLLLSNVAGVLRADGSLIDRWDSSQEPRVEDTQGTSKFGRGGMHTKIRVAKKAAGMGVETWIASGRSPAIVRRIVGDRTGGTCFPAGARSRSAKRWVAASHGHEKGRVVVNDGAKAVLCDPARLASLLPVGIVRIDGGFEKGDILRIDDVSGRAVGYGRAEYDARTALECCGVQDCKPLIHYDYLVINEDAVR